MKNLNLKTIGIQEMNTYEMQRKNGGLGPLAAFAMGTGVGAVIAAGIFFGSWITSALLSKKGQA